MTFASSSISELRRWFASELRPDPFDTARHHLRQLIRADGYSACTVPVASESHQPHHRFEADRLLAPTPRSESAVTHADSASRASEETSGRGHSVSAPAAPVPIRNMATSGSSTSATKTSRNALGHVITRRLTRLHALPMDVEAPSLLMTRRNGDELLRASPGSKLAAQSLE
jgi:hypothetical protein